MSSNIIFILECIGTVAFAITGVLVAVSSNLDLFGVCFIGCITAVGGGIMRDLVLGIAPPLVFDNIVMILLALIVSIAVFVLLYIKRDIYHQKDKIEHINNVFDAIGLGVFSIMGAETACAHGFQDNLLLVTVTGALTGIGGGMLRDICTKNIPSVLRKHVYAVASLVGILVFYFTKRYIEHLAISSAAAVLIVVAIRLLAAKYRWSLPKVNIGSESCNSKESKEADGKNAS